MGKMLAIEFSPKVIRVVEFQPGDPPVRISRAAAAERPGGEPAAVGQFLREFLARNGFTAKEALVSYLGPVIEHRIYAIPPVTGTTREELLRGKIAQESPVAVAELRVTGEVIGKLAEKGFERHEVMTLFTPEFEIRRLVYILIEAGLTPERVITVPVALAGLHPADAADELCGFLHLEPTRCVICVSGAGKLRFAREFALKAQDLAGAAPGIPAQGIAGPGGGEPPSSGEAVLAERLVMELTRSLLYFRQISQGGSISRLYWSGDPPSEETRRLISERLKFDIGAHPAEKVAVFEAGAKRDPGVFGVPIGMAATGWGPDRVNLLPVKFLQRKERRGSYIALAVILLAFLGADAGLYKGLRNASNRYREVLASFDEVTRSMSLSPEETARWMELSSALGDAARGEKAYAHSFTRWKSLFAALGAAVPPDMRLLSATFTPAEPAGRARRSRRAGTSRSSTSTSR
ncbi:MAG: Type pilus assembly protein PilM [Deltaproteobacteria bacterium]|nr:Type pilus assembly protein PilM [Deltaproteobacteria bacterium]